MRLAGVAGVRGLRRRAAAGHRRPRLAHRRVEAHPGPRASPAHVGLARRRRAALPAAGAGRRRARPPGVVRAQARTSRACISRFRRPPRSDSDVTSAPCSVAIRAGTKGRSALRVDDIDGRPAVVITIDPTDRKGALTSADGQSIAVAAQTALDKRVPLVGSIASSGADIVEGIAALHGWGNAARAIVPSARASCRSCSSSTGRRCPARPCCSGSPTSS